MAGGKETPRQKMIGMMYLVFVALLALNVTRTVLEKFVFINESMEEAIQEGKVRNNGTVSRISKAVDDSGNREADVKVLNTAKEVREQTSIVLKEMDAYKEEIVKVTGGIMEDGQFKDIANEEKVANLMINQKEGEKLKKLLNDYVSFLQQRTGMDFKKIALDGSEHPDFMNDPDQKRKSFSELNFAHTPMSASLATISQMQTEIVNMEAQALDDLARDVGAADIKFDNIVAMVRPESKVVAAGATYEAEMFIAASSSGIIPTMQFNGNEIPVENGMGKVKFTASPGNYDKDGLAKKSFEAKIVIPGPDGQPKEYTQTVDYFVAKPVIQIQSASVQALYLNCGNEMNVQVPALGTAYNPSFTASGAAVIEGKEKGKVTLVPNASEVVLNVSNNGNKLGSETFKVKRIPKPEIQALTRGKELNQRQGMPVPGPRSIEIKAIAEPSFAEFLPKDARYRVSQFEITLARGTRPVDSKKVSGEEVDLTSFASKARPGDRLVIEVKEVQRMNFRGNVEKVSMGDQIITIPLN